MLVTQRYAAYTLLLSTVPDAAVCIVEHLLRGTTSTSIVRNY